MKLFFLGVFCDFAFSNSFFCLVFLLLVCALCVTLLHVYISFASILCGLTWKQSIVAHYGCILWKIVIIAAVFGVRFFFVSSVWFSFLLCIQLVLPCEVWRQSKNVFAFYPIYCVRCAHAIAFLLNLKEMILFPQFLYCKIPIFCYVLFIFIFFLRALYLCFARGSLFVTSNFDFNSKLMIFKSFTL